MTGFGKLLAFLNIFASITMLSWTLSAYANRLDWVDAKTESGSTPGQISRLKQEVTELQKLIADAHNMYGQQSNIVGSIDSVKYFRSAELRRRLNEAQGIGPDGQPRESVFRVQKPESATSPLTDLSTNAATLPVILDPSDQPLRGLNSLQADFNKESGIIRTILLGVNGRLSTDEQLNMIADLPTTAFDTQVTGLGLEDLRRMHGLMSDRIALANIAIAKQKEIRQNLKDEALYLSDKRISWVAELQALEIRARQLQGRLQQLGGTRN